MKQTLDLDAIDWAKGDGLLPAVVQDVRSGVVLMLGYMNRAALEQTLASKRVTFHSRSRNALWTKGETSGHWLDLVDVAIDCDADTLLLLAHPNGPTCHRGTPTCFDPVTAPVFSELATLDATIAQRVRDRPAGSYTSKLIELGALRVAQKVGEEGVEVALAGAAQSTEQLEGEAADLLYHLGVLLHVRGSSLAAVQEVLRTRRMKPKDIA
jgi:phosphoribosyl-AMP cyclohydrolase / phosphoribosyl-ATP pyrophosphohydrolase